MLTIYHNPRCSKSREALAILESACAEHAQELKVIDYQKTPLSVGQLTTLLEQLGGDVQQMLRNNEAEYAEKNLAEADDSRALQAIADCPNYCNVLSLHSMEERS
jgi:arsenate reductase